MASRYCQQLSSDTRNLCRIIGTPEPQTLVNYSTQYQQLKRRMTVSSVHSHASCTNRNILCPKSQSPCTSNILSEIVNPQKQELPKFLKGPHLRGGYTTGHFIPLPLNSGTLGSSGVPRYSYRTRGSNLMESHEGFQHGIFKNYGPPLL